MRNTEYGTHIKVHAVEADICCQFRVLLNAKYRKHKPLGPVPNECQTVPTPHTTVSLHSDSLYMPERDGEN